MKKLLIEKTDYGFTITLDGVVIQNSDIDAWISYCFSKKELQNWLKDNSQNLFGGDE